MVIYPEGTTTKEPDLWPMRGKTGAARLALATGAPVIPVAMWGPERIFDPRTQQAAACVPRTPVTVVAGPPIDLSRWAGAAPTTATPCSEITDAHHADAARHARRDPGRHAAAAVDPPASRAGRDAEG